MVENVMKSCVTASNGVTPNRPCNKELIQNSLIELEREISALELSLSILYGSETEKRENEIETINSFSFNTTVIEVPNIINILRDRINECRADVDQLDSGK